MVFRLFTLLLTLLFVSIGWGGTRASAAVPADTAGVEFFEKKIRPLLVGKCASCHGPTLQLSGYRADDPAAAIKGGNRGAAVLPGDPDKSVLVRAVRFTDPRLQMPPGGKLSDAQIADLVAWVKNGAPIPRAPKGHVPPTKKPASVVAARKNHWSYRPVRRVPPPAVRDAAWPASPVDAFLLHKLEAKGLRPAPDADRRTLLRRVTFGLTGLPPAPAEVDAFLSDRSPRAYEKVVDRLLASPAYGERWARHWLDLVRFAETMGHENDYPLPNAWQYRDYVIRAFNADVPYDRFVTEQIAGDLLPSPRRHPTQGFNESILGTGALMLGEAVHSPVDVRQDQANRMDNQIDVIGKAFLAQTLACARCHDHKFDPITEKDYYAMAGFLKSSRYQQAHLDPGRKIDAATKRLTELKGRIRRSAGAGIGTAWAMDTDRVAEYLMAARGDVCGVVGNGDVAQPLDPNFRQKWVELLKSTDGNDPAGPFYPWKKLACAEDGAAAPRSLRSELDSLRKRNEESQGRYVNFVESTGAQNWRATGGAFAPAEFGGADFLPGHTPSRPVRRFLPPGGADSARLSPALEGELRSPTFTIEKDFIHFRVSGREGRIRLVVDGFFMITDPIYGGLSRPVNGESPRWQTMNVRAWKGHRAYIELADGPVSLPTEAPAVAEVRREPGRGYLRVDRILLSDENGPPPPVPFGLPSLDGAEIPPLDALSRAYGAAVRGALERWRTPVPTSPLAERDARLLQALLSHGLLDGDVGKPAAPKGSGESAPLLEEYRRLEASLPPPMRAVALADGTGEDESVLLRGNPHTPGDRVPRRFLEVFGGHPVTGTEGSGRLELAKRMTDPENPLFARVIVNRIWQHHFGQGIVRTPDDFGHMGERPTHPELLDYLASEFVRGGGSMKKFHRTLLLTRAYRMSGRADPKARMIDPQNRLLQHMPLRRLEAEAVRDAILAASGGLNRRRYGPGVLPYLTPFMEGRGRPPVSGPLDGDRRRSIYLNVRRNFLTPMFLAFDYPTPSTTIGRRSVSNVPAQALALMNDPFVIGEARRWAAQLPGKKGETPEAKVRRLYVTAFSRPPSAEETREALAFVARQSKLYAAPGGHLSAWADLCHVLFNTKEFIFIR